MKTINDVFGRYKQVLINIYDNNEAEAITLMAIGQITDSSNARIKAFPELELSRPQIEKLDDILTQLKTGKPIQYALGKTEFYGLPFYVNPSVLIPRPETEELVQWAIDTVLSAVSSGQVKQGNILDIGTGSGCIAISLEKHLPGFEVSAIDISKEALETARSNARLNDADVKFVEADILNLKEETGQPGYEVIISNPPYVTLLDKIQMHVNVTGFEPHTALFVPKNDPLIFYKAIADFALNNLVSNGLLFFEINESYGDDVISLLAGKNFNNIALRKDMSGRDRMVKAEKG